VTRLDLADGRSVVLKVPPAGYGPVDLDPLRLALYRVHLALLMLAEMPSRRMTDPVRFRRLTEHLEAELAELAELAAVAAPRQD
jgi:hypothetical protein